MHCTSTCGAKCASACNLTGVPCIAGAAGLDDEDMACAEALVEYSSDREGGAAWQEELKTHLQSLMNVDQELIKVSQLMMYTCPQQNNLSMLQHTCMQAQPSIACKRPSRVYGINPPAISLYLQHGSY
jgi:hypothetical protein